MARSKSIRGQISSPIPITDHMDEAVILPTITLAKSSGVKHVTIKSPSEEEYQFRQPAIAAQMEPAVAGNMSGSRFSDVVSNANSRPSTMLRGSRDPTTNPATARNSEVNTQRAGVTQDKKERKRQKSGLRGAVEKLFGKKKKTSSTASANAEVFVPIYGNDLDTERRLDGNAEGLRSASVPIAELDRALRSHSIGLEDVLAIESARNSMTAEQAPQRKRAATMSSTYTRGSRLVEESKVGGLSPRPASPQERTPSSHTVNEDPEEIGKAITSDFKTLKRRSRSMSAIPFLESPRDETRRRSEECRPPRDSHHQEMMPPISPDTPERAALRAFSLGLPPSTVPQTPASPPQQFNFGNFGGNVEPNAPKFQPEPEIEAEVSQQLDTRVEIVEQRLWKLEDTVSNLKQETTTIKSQVQANEPVSFSILPKPTPTLKGFSTITHSQSQILVPSDRPMSDPTVQKNTTIVTLDQYNSLLRQLDSERSARQALETQVQQLSRQLNLLSQSPAYSHSLEQYRLLNDTPINQTSVFDEDDDEDDDEESIDYKKIPRESYTLEDSGFVTANPDDEDDSFVTPHEGHRTFGMFDQKAPRVMALMSPTIM